MAIETRPDQSVEIIPFETAHAAAFRALNLDWIRVHWEPEPSDYKVLDNPQASIIDQGGYIAIAVLRQEVVGTCALLKMDDATFELAKMTVTDAVRGAGIGRKLANDVLAKARALGAQRVYLESNTVLEPAIRLYRELGFQEIAAQPSPYERANIQMELFLS